MVDIQSLASLPGAPAAGRVRRRKVGKQRPSIVPRVPAVLEAIRVALDQAPQSKKSTKAASKSSRGIVNDEKTSSAKAASQPSKTSVDVSADPSRDTSINADVLAPSQPRDEASAGGLKRKSPGSSKGSGSADDKPSKSLGSGEVRRYDSSKGAKRKNTGQPIEAPVPGSTVSNSSSGGREQTSYSDQNLKRESPVQASESVSATASEDLSKGFTTATGPSPAQEEGQKRKSPGQNKTSSPTAADGILAPKSAATSVPKTSDGLKRKSPGQTKTSSSASVPKASECLLAPETLAASVPKKSDGQSARAQTSSKGRKRKSADESLASILGSVAMQSMAMQKAMKPPEQLPMKPLSLPPLPDKCEEDNYEISDMEEDAKGNRVEPNRTKKRVPAWSLKITELVKSQASINPDSIFGSRVPKCDLDAIFPDKFYVGPGGIRLHERPVKRRRGSSALWFADRLTKTEIATYSSHMGQKRRLSVFAKRSRASAKVDLAHGKQQGTQCIEHAA